MKVNNSSESNDTLYYKLTYPNPEEYRMLHANSFLEFPQIFQTEIEQSSRMLPDQDGINFHFRTLANSTIQFAYKFNVEAVFDTINVEITSENPVYEFGY
ncbi:hypothetical protein LB467_12240 [Salegentibacter sp. JZCK2]|uniref:hypothetical protein n=1 Tax=Salegentibacter tibetensis TaxID=2873600 RepID=UPI001CCC9F50|nr:hypothetical protein [Salegentibacter tibetensis]MBZ9730456.1 hypothetical protein [Salegentibacter tibetensis]